MDDLTLNSNPKVALKFQSYPKAAHQKLQALRKLIIATAKKEETISEIEETLKWGEPSYLVKKGSTIRIDWKEKAPEQYAIYFKCTSKLVPTFREVYGDTFKYENNRAIQFDLKDKVPQAALQNCIRLALTYHSVKNLPRLGL
jgi:hypothetical protein